MVLIWRRKLKRKLTRAENLKIHQIDLSDVLVKMFHSDQSFSEMNRTVKEIRMNKKNGIERTKKTIAKYGEISFRTTYINQNRLSIHRDSQRQRQRTEAQKIDARKAEAEKKIDDLGFELLRFDPPTEEKDANSVFKIANKKKPFYQFQFKLRDEIPTKTKTKGISRRYYYIFKCCVNDCDGYLKLRHKYVDGSQVQPLLEDSRIPSLFTSKNIQMRNKHQIHGKAKKLSSELEKGWFIVDFDICEHGTSQPPERPTEKNLKITFDPPSEQESSIVTLEHSNGDIHQYQYHSRQSYSGKSNPGKIKNFKYIFVCENPDCGGFAELYKKTLLVNSDKVCRFSAEYTKRNREKKQRGNKCKWDEAFHEGWRCLSKNVCEHKFQSEKDSFSTDKGLKMEGINEQSDSLSAGLHGTSSSGGAGLIKTDTSENEKSENPEFRCFHCDEMIPSHLIKQHWDECLSGNSVSGFINPS